MTNIENFILTLKQEWNESPPRGINIKIKCNPSSEEEYFSLSYAGGVIGIESSCPQGVICGISLAKTAIASGHLAEYLGRHSPKYSLRLLWIKSVKIKSLEETDGIHKLCQRILLLGYNTVIIDLDIVHLPEILSSLPIFKRYGLQLALKPPVPVLSKQNSFEATLEDCLFPLLKMKGVIDYLFWESTIYHTEFTRHLQYRDFLEIDFAHQEIETLCDIAGNHFCLIYALPAPNISSVEKQSCWIPKLCNEISEDVYLAFSAHAGDPCEDFLPPHSLWEKLRSVKHITKRNLIPMVNIGLVNQGDGLWPILSLDKISQYITRSHALGLSGIIAMTSHIPREDALLSCSLWTASQAIWGSGEPGLLAESWVNAKRPDIYKCPGWQSLLHEVREIVLKIGFLRSSMKEKKAEPTKEEFRILTNSLLARLKSLDSNVNALKFEISDRPNIKSHCLYFLRDARRLIFRFLQHYHMPIVGILDGDDMKPSFWTEIANPNSQGITSNVDVVVLQNPRRGEPDSFMDKIYAEVFTDD